MEIGRHESPEVGPLYRRLICRMLVSSACTSEAVGTSTRAPQHRGSLKARSRREVEESAHRAARRRESRGSSARLPDRYCGIELHCAWVKYEVRDEARRVAASYRRRGPARERSRRSRAGKESVCLWKTRLRRYRAHVLAYIVEGLPKSDVAELLASRASSACACLGRRGHTTSITTCSTLRAAKLRGEPGASSLRLPARSFFGASQGRRHLRTLSPLAVMRPATLLDLGGLRRRRRKLLAHLPAKLCVPGPSLVGLPAA